MIVEIPQGGDDSPLCAARQALFGAMTVDPTGIRTGTAAAIWTRTSSNRRQHLEPLSVDVVGQGFYDGEHCDAQGVGQTHGTRLANATCWELHPIVQLTVASPAAGPLLSVLMPQAGKPGGPTRVATR